MPGPLDQAAVGRSGEPPAARMPIGAGVCGVFGILWLLGSMFLVGVFALSSRDARDIDRGSGLALLGHGASIAIWACGLGLVGLYLIALVRRRYLPAALAVLTPLLAGTVLYVGPAESADWWGSVPTPGVAASAAVVVLAIATAVALMTLKPQKADNASRMASESIRMPTSVAALVVGAAGLVLTVVVIAMSSGLNGWFRTSPWGVVVWVLVLAGIWRLVYRLWRKSGGSQAVSQSSRR